MERTRFCEEEFTAVVCGNVNHPTFNTLYSVAEAVIEYRSLRHKNAPAFRLNDAVKKLDEALTEAGFGEKLAKAMK